MGQRSGLQDQCRRILQRIEDNLEGDHLEVKPRGNAIHVVYAFLGVGVPNTRCRSLCASCKSQAIPLMYMPGRDIDFIGQCKNRWWWKWRRRSGGGGGGGRRRRRRRRIGGKKEKRGVTRQEVERMGGTTEVRSVPTETLVRELVARKKNLIRSLAFEQAHAKLAHHIKHAAGRYLVPVDRSNDDELALFGHERREWMCNVLHIVPNRRPKIRGKCG